MLQPNWRTYREEGAHEGRQLPSKLGVKQNAKQGSHGQTLFGKCAKVGMASDFRARIVAPLRQVCMTVAAAHSPATRSSSVT